MKQRLLKAKRLLKNDGVIFISIGKEENATLRILCNEIFGENNMLGQLVRRTKTTSFRGNYFALRLDYVLCYCGGTTLPDKFMDAQQAQALKDRKITVNIIPDYYYKELEG